MCMPAIECTSTLHSRIPIYWLQKRDPGTGWSHVREHPSPSRFISVACGVLIYRFIFRTNQT